MSESDPISAPASLAAENQSIAALPSRTEAVTGAIERAIFDGEYVPGDRLVERDLAARLGVSKTPVREALRALVGRGLAVAHPYRGVRVREISPDMVRNLYGVRLLLEPAAVRESVAVHSAEDLGEARVALEAGSAAAQKNDLGGLVVANRKFHQALSAGCPNALLVSILDDIRDQMALVVVWDWRLHQNWAGQAKEHQAILAAAEAGDADVAAARLEAHIRRAMLDGLSHFDGVVPSGAVDAAPDA